MILRPAPCAVREARLVRPPSGPEMLVTPLEISSCRKELR